MNKFELTPMKSYVVGFVLSVVFTLIAFTLVGNSMLHGAALLWTISGLALIQLVVQLVFFLHLGRESKPRWNLMAFLFMVLVLVVVVGGSLWIMKNLDYNMTPGKADTYIKSQDKGGF